MLIISKQKARQGFRPANLLFCFYLNKALICREKISFVLLYIFIRKEDDFLYENRHFFKKTQFVHKLRRKNPCFFEKNMIFLFFSQKSIDKQIFLV